MDREWRELKEFPNYAVSTFGEFINTRTDSAVQPSQNQQGHLKVSLYRDRRLVTRSVALLVAQAFVPGSQATFDTPIHLDGDLANCNANNLMWRPRWFAIKFHRQFDNRHFIEDTAVRMDVETGRKHNSMEEVCSTYGLHYHDVINSEFNGEPCFPTWQIFRVV